MKKFTAVKSITATAVKIKMKISETLLVSLMESPMTCLIDHENTEDIEKPIYKSNLFGASKEL